jgi:hypothetical protein
MQLQINTLGEATQHDRKSQPDDHKDYAKNVYLSHNNVANIDL